MWVYISLKITMGILRENQRLGGAQQGKLRPVSEVIGFKKLVGAQSVVALVCDMNEHKRIQIIQ